MKKLALAFAIFAAPTLAFAYQIPTPMTISDTFKGGEGEVDFTRASNVSGTIKIDTTNGESAWLTAGDVSGGNTGYGFFIHDDQLFGVSRTNANSGQRMLPLGYVQAGTEITLKASFTPGEGVRFDTSAEKAYSRGIIMDYLPGWMRGLGAFNSSVTSRNNPANLFVGTWSYTE